ncbi:MAG: diaminopimelate decarboxylase [Muribaculaceae bacterium]|nr:diaminopimelate decarboxylase [Muribaculaceae bacterium]
MITIDELQNIGTPCYCYDAGLLKLTLESISKAASCDKRFNIHYAVKANFRPEILNIISAAGLGADCVTGWEIDAALKAGFPASKIVYAGVGKTDDEIVFALQNEIESFNVESLPELKVLNELAIKEGCVANVAIRVNPGIDAHTHKYITTGLNDNKFGITIDLLDSVIEIAQSLPGINLVGLHFHIGSQITEFDCFKLLCDCINELYAKYAQKGIVFKSINVGGGLGIDYQDPDRHPIPDFNSYFEVFAKNLILAPDTKIHFELGRSVVAQCGSLLTKVLYVKETSTRRFAIVDAGMTDLIRPALYQAHHRIDPVYVQSNGQEEYKYDVVGPICESSDVFGTDELLPALERGDILALRSAGAYGEAMASNYNMRPLPSYYIYNTTT